MRKFLPLHMYLPFIFTCKAKAPPMMGGAQTVEKPRRAREGQSPLELSIEPSGVYGGKVACLKASKSLRDRQS